MIGNLLTGIDDKEQTEVRLQCDTDTPQTVFVIKNAPHWADLEVGRVAHVWEMAGYNANHAVNYAWISLCLLEMRNVNSEGDSVMLPRTEEYRTRTGDREKRIPMEWLVRHLGKRYELLEELSTAIYSYNHLTGAERKNWTWPLASERHGAQASSPVKNTQTTAEPTEPAASGAGSASSEPTPQQSRPAA